MRRTSLPIIDLMKCDDVQSKGNSSIIVSNLQRRNSRLKNALNHHYEDAVRSCFASPHGLKKGRDRESFFSCSTLAADGFVETDRWWRFIYPKTIRDRRPLSHLTHDELLRCVEWKFQRGQRRHPLTSGLRNLNPEAVRRHSTAAIGLLDKGNFQGAIDEICSLKNVGPATATALLAPLSEAGAVPFLSDELLEVATGKRNYTVTSYRACVHFLEEHCDDLNRVNNSNNNKKADSFWNPERLQRALWAYGQLVADPGFDHGRLDHDSNSNDASVPERNHNEDEIIGKRNKNKDNAVTQKNRKKRSSATVNGDRPKRNRSKASK